MRTAKSATIRAIPYEELSRVLSEFEVLKVNPYSATRVYFPTKRGVLRKLRFERYDREVVEVLKEVIELLKSNK